MLALSHPAPLWETLELAQAHREGLKPWQRRALVMQLLGSDTVAFRDSRGLIAVAGFMPLAPEVMGEELAEAWFLCRPALGRHLTAFVRLGRLTLGRTAEDGRVRIRAFVRAGHAPGARLAALCGLSRVAVAGDFETWEWSRGAVREVDLRRKDHGAEERVDRAAAAGASEPRVAAGRGKSADPGAGAGSGPARPLHGRGAQGQPRPASAAG